MLKFSFKKNQLSAPIQMVSNAVDKRQLLPILSSLLVRFQNNQLQLTATDLEIEFTAFIPFEGTAPEAPFTIPAKKFLDVLRTLDDEDVLNLKIFETNLQVICGSSQFKFPFLSPTTFPLIQTPSWTQEIVIPKQSLLRLLESTAFAVSQQDIRIFLNGLLFECDELGLTTVGADGHRMAISKYQQPLTCAKERFIFPRKGVTELLRFLNSVPDETVKLYLHPNLFRIETTAYVFTSKLIDAQYLPYQQAIPRQLQTFVMVEVDVLKRALARILIVANDRSRPVILNIDTGQFSFLAANQEQEEVIESIDATVDGPSLKIGLNPVYLLEVLNVFKTSHVRLSFHTPDTSILVESLDDETYQYIIMPMKI